MGASSSGLLDEAKISHIKGLVDSAFRSFSVFYHQQYAVTYFGHLYQEVEPKKEGRGLLLTHRPQYAPEEVLYQSSVKFSCWDEQGKKCRERYAVLRRHYRVEIHDNMETFSRGCAAKLVLQPAGASVFTTEEESKAHLKKTCAGILNGVKEDSSSVVSSPDVFVVYLHLPYRGHACFLFQQEEERDRFLSALKKCIRHQNLDPWCDSSYESQAYARALRLYRQDKGCYESWEMLLGTEEQVLASQVMEEVLPWLEAQLQSRVKGKKIERIRQWLATVQATYTLVLEQLTAGLEVLREECRQTASANQALIRSNLDQIMSSHSFLAQKVRDSICEEADKVCSESVAPYLSSILEALTENISAGILGMQQALHSQMDSAFSKTNGGAEETKKALSSLSSISLEQCYKQVEKLREKLEDLKQRFGLSSTERLVHSAHLEMERLLDSAVYTLEQFLQSSVRLQPSQVPVKMQKAKERVLKQLDYDSRVVQRKLYQEALVEIALPSLTRKMDSKWKTELQQFEQYIFSDYSTFILVHNVYDDVLRNILSAEIETVVQDAASKKSNNLLLDTSDLAISQYSLLGQTPPCSAPNSPAVHARQSSSAVPSDDQESAPVVEEKSQKADVCPQPEFNAETKPDLSTTQYPKQSAVLVSPVILVTQQLDETESAEAPCSKETSEEVQTGDDAPSTATESTTAAESSNSEASVTHDIDTPVPAADHEVAIIASPDPSLLVSPQSTDVQAGYDQSATPETPAGPDLLASEQISEEVSSIQPPTPRTDSPGIINLVSLTEAIYCSSTESSVTPTMVQQMTDRAVYLTGEIKDNWEVERMKQEKDKEGAEKEEDGSIREEKKETEKEDGTEEERVKEETERVKEEQEAAEKEGNESIREEKKETEKEDGTEEERVKEETERVKEETERVKEEQEAAEKEGNESIREEKKETEKEEGTKEERVKEDKQKEAAETEGNEPLKEGKEEGIEVERVKEEKEAGGKEGNKIIKEQMEKEVGTEEEMVKEEKEKVAAGKEGIKTIKEQKEETENEEGTHGERVKEKKQKWTAENEGNETMQQGKEEIEKENRTEEEEMAKEKEEAAEKEGNERMKEEDDKEDGTEEEMVKEKKEAAEKEGIKIIKEEKEKTEKDEETEERVKEDKQTAEKEGNEAMQQGKEGMEKENGIEMGERVKEEKQEESAEKEGNKQITEEKEEKEKEEGTEEHKGKGQIQFVAQRESEPLSEASRSNRSPAESATTVNTEQRLDDEEMGTELKREMRTEDEKEASEKEEKKEIMMEEEVLQSPQLMESQPESPAELPLDSVAIIRELVTEIIEVETVIIPPSQQQ